MFFASSSHLKRCSLSRFFYLGMCFIKKSYKLLSFFWFVYVLDQPQKSLSFARAGGKTSTRFNDSHFHFLTSFGPSLDGPPNVIISSVCGIWCPWWPPDSRAAVSPDTTYTDSWASVGILHPLRYTPQSLLNSSFLRWRPIPVAKTENRGPSTCDRHVWASSQLLCWAAYVFKK